MTDEEAVLEVHKKWFDAAVDLDVETARECYVKGDHLVMFNTNGHVYHGVEELAQLWKHYGETVKLSACTDDAPPRVQVDGDLAVITCEREYMDVTPLKEDGWGTSVMEELEEDEYTRYPFFATEIYKRDDGDGNGEWRIWHQHYSVIAPEGETKPGF